MFKKFLDLIKIIFTNDTFSLLFSALSLVISFIALHKNGSNLRFIVKHVLLSNDEFDSKCEIHGELINKSSQPIAIHNVAISNLNYCFCIKEPVVITEEGIPYNDKVLELKNYSLKLPCYLAPYQSEMIYFVLLLDKDISLTKKNKLIIYTSRKKVICKLSPKKVN